MPHLPSQYQEYIALSRYARWLPEEHRRETWDETVARYVEYWVEKFPDILNADTNIQPKELFNSIYNLDVMPSMRALMTAGPALDRDNVAGFNPVTGDTRVVTKEFGTLPIANLEGKSATVLNKDGRWVDAEFRGYGKQPIYKVTAKLNSNTVKDITCTANHRWVKQDGSVVPTTGLVNGDRIDFVSAPKPEIDADYNLGIMHGLVYGDGTTAKSCERVKGYVIRLCGDDNRELLKYFDGYPVTYPPSANGDPLVQMYDDFAATHSLKDLPSHEETDSYLLGFMRGWLAADGSVTKNSQVSLCVAGEGLEWLTRNAERLGFTIQRTYKQPAETNYGKRKQESWVVYFSRSSMVSDDFLCSWKRANFKPLKSHWVVHSVESAGYDDSVYCAEVEDTNTFVLEGGLLTGNCSFLAINRVRAFDELMYILMCGTGVGFSCERQEISQLPSIPEEMYETDTTIIVRDSKIGWASAYRELISLLYAGKMPKWDLSKIRPAGAPLKVFGGRASGPDPLNDLFNYTTAVFRDAVGRKLTSVEVHGVVCKIAEVVVVGGVRRSALISLSNLTDERMRHAKSGQWWEEHPEYALANNSIAYTEKPDAEIFMQEWLALVRSKSGERGIFNRVASAKQAAKNGRRDDTYNFGTNPCSEIILRDRQFCNLSEVVVRDGDTLKSLKRKVRIATILGTLQATLTDFRYLSKKWKENTEEEALLGVSLTGIMDHPILSGSVADYESRSKFAGGITVRDNEVPHLQDILEYLKEVAIETNKEWSKKLGINQSAAITCVKPSGTVSQLVDSASGIHPRYSPYYIRTVRADKKDPLATMMVDKGFPVEDDVTKPHSTYVFSFPMKAPPTAVFRDDRPAIDQLNHWLVYQRHWCEHKPSVTIYVKESEWPSVGGWVYDHFDELSGVSFLPHSDHTYRQAPYQEISKEEYETLLANMPEDINWSDLCNYEKTDTTESTHTLACTGGQCEI